VAGLEAGPTPQGIHQISTYSRNLKDIERKRVKEGEREFYLSVLLVTQYIPHMKYFLFSPLVVVSFRI
jgi:hypothetical protein